METVAFTLFAVVITVTSIWSLVAARRAMAGREVETGLRARADLEPIRVPRRVRVEDQRSAVRAA